MNSGRVTLAGGTLKLAGTTTITGAGSPKGVPRITPHPRK
jgi:hypothetical protein